MKKVCQFLNQHFEEACMGILLVAMTIVMFLQVVLRLFNIAFSWPEEFSRYCFVYITFLSIGYCVQRNSMLRVDFLATVVPEKISKVIDIIILTCCLALYAYLAYYSVVLIWQIAETGRVSTALQLPYTFIYSSLALGFALAVLRSVQMLIKMLRNFNSPKENKEEKGVGAA